MSDQGDSQMLSSPDNSDNENINPAHIATPPHQTISSSSILSPPSSQPRQMPTSASGSSIANSNGKRPIHTISNGTDNMEELAAMANGKARQDLPVKTHQSSGYQWSREEDAPGYAWMNKKAVDEYQRAWDNLVHQEKMIGDRYGDPIEMAEKEKAVLNSAKQQ